MLTKIKKYLNVNNAILLAACILAFVWVFGSISVMNHNYDLQQQVDQANLDNQILDIQNKNLKLEQAYFQTDEFLDLQARALLGKSEKGENLVLLPLNKTNFTDNKKTNSIKTSNESNLNQWMNFLFGN